MFSKEFDWTMAVLLAVLAIVFFLGKGEPVLNLFSGKYARKNDREPEKERKYQNAIGFFMLALCAGEVLLALTEVWYMGLVMVGIDVVSLIALMVYIRKVIGE